MARHTAGWIKLHRRVLEDHSWVGHDAVALGIFVTLLLMANYEDGYTWTRQGVLVKRGQVVTSDRELAKRLAVARSTVKRKLDRMYQDKMLDHQSDHQGTIITIVNYDKYQGSDDDAGPPSGPPTDHRRTTGGPILEKREEEQENKKTPPARARVDPELLIEQVLQTTLSVAEQLAERQDNGEHLIRELVEAEAAEAVGPLGASLIRRRYANFSRFWKHYALRVGKTPVGMVNAQIRKELLAVYQSADFGTLEEVPWPGDSEADHGGLGGDDIYYGGPM